MDDNEYYAMMRRQYSNIIQIAKKKKTESSKAAQQADKAEFNNSADGTKTPGTFSEWTKKYGHEDAEMFYERNTDDE